MSRTILACQKTGNEFYAQSPNRERKRVGIDSETGDTLFAVDCPFCKEHEHYIALNYNPQETTVDTDNGTEISPSDVDQEQESRDTAQDDGGL
jgi:hypothetical protein